MENSTDNPYFITLQEVIDPMIIQVSENSFAFPEDKIIFKEKIVFQKDKCPTHRKK